METGLDGGNRLGGTASLALKHVETGACIFLKLCGVALAVGALNVVLEILLV